MAIKTKIQNSTNEKLSFKLKYLKALNESIVNILNL